MYEQCIDMGGDEGRCAMAAREELSRCIEEHCDAPQPPACKDKCEAIATHVFQACTATIDSEEKLCEQIAGWVLEHCNDGCEDPGPTECRSDDDCRDGHICQIEVCVNTCVDDDPICVDTCLGVCVPGEEPCVCPAIFDPVCGEDGNIYSNACEAECAGVAIDEDCGGACDDGDSDSDCDDGDSDSDSDGDSDSGKPKPCDPDGPMPKKGGHCK